MNKKTILVFVFLIIGAYVLGNYQSKLSPIATPTSDPDLKTLEDWNSVVSGNFPTPNTNPTSEQQRQCGEDAREFMKQYSLSQILLESSFSTSLQACVAYTEDSIEINGNPLAPVDKKIYNIAKNQILGWYQAPNSKLGTKDGYTVFTESFPEGNTVNYQGWQSYLKSLGLSGN